MSEAVTIGRISARFGEEIDPLRVRLRVSHLLATADFQPKGLPAQAILLIRRLAAPQPLALQNLRVSPQWERTLQAETTALYQRAARPQNGIVAPEADAVLFADRAELLAYLGNLTVAPQPSALWLWQSSAGPRSPFPNSAALTELWRESPRFVPAALEILMGWRAAIPLLKTLSEAQAAVLFAAVAQEFGLDITAQELDTFAPRLPPQADAQKAETEALPFSAEARTEEGRQEKSASIPALFARTFSSSGGAWATVDALQEIPVFARSLLLISRAISGSSSLSQARIVLRSLAALRVEPEAETPLETRERKSAGGTAAPPFQSEISPKNAALPAPKPEENRETLSTTNRNAPSDSPNDARMWREETPNLPAPVEPSEIEETPAAPPAYFYAGQEGTFTALGGVFYLIGFLLKGESAARLEAELSLAEPFPFWQFLERFARRLLASRLEDFQADSLWSLLARLDNRDGPLPAAFPDEPDKEGRLNAFFARLESELIERIGTKNVAPLLAVPAIVYMTRIHLDVEIALDRIFLPARLAGLDQNPGWIPELTRVVSFHFR